VFQQIDAWVRIGRGIPHAKDFLSFSALSLFQRISAI
jgi:hypothetical protein